MAGIGLYGVYYAKCTMSDGVVTGYEGGTKTLGKAISASFEPTEPDNNPLYANNAIAENDSSSGAGGTLTLTLDRLKQEAAVDLYGLTLKNVAVTVNTESVNGSGFDFTGSEQSAPVGVAFIKWNQVNDDRNNHEVVIYRKVTFGMPTIDAQTLGETIEWQTPEITGTVSGKDGNGSNPWYQTYVFPSQAAAIAYIVSIFGAEAATT